VTRQISSAFAQEQDSREGLSLPGELKLRLASCWQQKLLLTVGICLFFWGTYSFLSRHALFRLRTIPNTWLDVAIAFSPQPWGWIYLSQYLYAGTIPWLTATKSAIRRYVAGLTLMCGTSFLIFLFFPVRAPRPESFGPGAAFALIGQFDGALNAFPSLHAGFMIYTYALGWRLFGRRLPGAVIFGFLTWGCLILYSTLATKQHYAWDLVAGALLGFCSDRFAWRGSGPLHGRQHNALQQ
jgi:hypothetical protein